MTSSAVLIGWTFLKSCYINTNFRGFHNRSSYIFTPSRRATTRVSKDLIFGVYPLRTRYKWFDQIFHQSSFSSMTVCHI
jgi:hypothetical protein